MRRSQLGRLDESRVLMALLTRVRMSDVNSLNQAAEDGTRHNLVALLVEQSRQLLDLSDAVARRYFALTEKEPRWVRSGAQGPR
jgi:hypothetical protein